MDRRWLSMLFWTLLFAAGVWTAGRWSPRHEPLPVSALLGLSEVQEQPQLTGSETEGEQTSVAEPAATLTPARTARVRGPEEIATLIREDRLCDFVRAPVESRTLVQSMIVAAQSPLLQSLFGPRGPLGATPDSGARDEASLFYTALLLGGMIDGVAEVAPDPTFAERIFRDLQARDPGNGAYFYFHAGLARRMGRPLHEQHEIVLKMLETLKFNTFRPAIASELQKLARMNATAWYAVADGLRRLPTPQFPDAAFINYLISRDPLPVQAKAVQFGLMLMEQPHALIQEKTIGVQMVTPAWKRVYPRDPLPDLWKKHQQARRKSPAAKLERDLERAARPLEAEPCDRAPMDRAFSKHREVELAY